MGAASITACRVGLVPYGIQRKVAQQLVAVCAPGMLSNVAAQRGGGRMTLVRFRARMKCSSYLSRQVKSAEKFHCRCFVLPSVGEHRLHIGMAPMCVAGCGGAGCDTLAHYELRRRMRTLGEAAIGLPSRRMLASELLGLIIGMTTTLRSQAAHRVSVACLACHWLRAEWRAVCEPRRFSCEAGWVAFFERVMREVLAVVPLVVRSAWCRRWLGALQ